MTAWAALPLVCAEMCVLACIYFTNNDCWPERFTTTLLKETVEIC